MRKYLVTHEFFAEPQLMYEDEYRDYQQSYSNYGYEPFQVLAILEKKGEVWQLVESIVDKVERDGFATGECVSHTIKDEIVEFGGDGTISASS